MTDARPIPAAVPPVSALLAAADHAFAFFVFLIASDAFTFLGIHSLLWGAAYAYFALRVTALFGPFLLFLRNNLAYLAYPAACLLSLLWAEVPRAALAFSAQVTATVLIALFIAMRLPVEAIFRQLMRVWLLAMAASLANLGGAFAHPWDDRGNFKGIFLSKNAFGHRAVLFAIGCAFTAFLLPGVRFRRRLVYLAALAATGFMVAISGSATAMVLTIAFGALAALAALAMRRHGGALVAGPFLLGLALALVGIAAARIDPVAELFDLLGRDVTMTGRTILWRHGWEHYLERPVLGHGAAGFWQNPAFAGEIALLQASYGDGVGAFHNLVLELLVMLGPLGLLAHALAGLTTVRRAAVLVARGRDPMALWTMVTTLAIYGMALIGAQLFNPHAIPLILVVCLGAALGKRIDARRAT